MVKILSSNEHENRSLRVLVPLSLNNAIIYRNLSYHKLPKTLLKLSVLKLDGSSFGVEVSMNATVAELKLSLEEVFKSSPKDDQYSISWSHVWGHFCLCYEGQKLLNDKAYIRRLGIKDGDQIKFVRHISINYRPAKQRSRNLSIDLGTCSVCLSRSSVHEDTDQSCTIACVNVENQETNFNCYQYEEEETLFMPESRFAHFWKGWLSYRRFWGAAR